MCGRYASSRSDADLADVFDAVLALDGAQDDGLAPNYNVAPTQPVRIVIDRPDGERQLRTARWGLIPSWAADRKIGARMINARSETVTVKPAFRAAAAARRAIVPADGYYEWITREGAKIPYFLHGDDVLPMAGLYEFWRDRQADDDDPARWVCTVTVLTTTATDELGAIHDRSPVLIPADMRSQWLDPTLTSLDDVAAMIERIPSPRLTPYEVSTQVNSVRNNGPELLTPV